MRRYILLIALLAATLAATAQTGFTVSGTLLTASNAMVDRAELRLLNAAGKLVQQTAAVQGRFAFDPVEKGSYTLVVWAAGQADLTLPLTIAENKHLALQMADRAVIKLDEVTVKSSGKAISYNNGNIKVDVANSVFRANPTPLDLLAKLPNVQLSPNREAVAVAGRGNAIIYIGNQRIGLTDLQSLNIDDIKSVEIISNPSAKYEAEGRAVILITRKSKKKEGHEWLFTENLSFKKYRNSYNGIGYSAKKGKTEYRANLNFNRINVWESNGVAASVQPQGIETSYLTVAPTRRRQWLLGGSVYRQQQEEDYYSLAVNGRIQQDAFNIITATGYQRAGIARPIQTFSRDTNFRHFVNTVFNVQKKVKGWNSLVFGGLQYGYYAQGLQTSLFNNVDNSGFVLDNLIRQGLALHTFSARTDMETALGKKWKLESGLLLVHTQTQTDFGNTTMATGNTDQAIYRLRETNSGLYAQASGSSGNLSYSAGARLEHTAITGRFATATANNLHRNFANLFPKARLDIRLDSLSSLTLNLARAIARPSFGSTGVGVAYINPYFVFATNLNLLPTLNNEASIAYQRKGKSVTLRVYRNVNPVNYSLAYNDAQNYIEFKPNNFASETGANLDLSWPFAIGKWSSVNNLSCVYNKIADPSAQLMRTAPYLYFYTNQSLRFQKIDLTVAYSAWGLTPRREGSYERNGLVVMNLDISKKWLGRLDTVLSFNDIFRQATYRDAFATNGIRANDVFYTDTKEFALSVKYALGKLKGSSYKQKAVNENMNRLN
jgi:hypothetical protein